MPERVPLPAELTRQPFDTGLGLSTGLTRDRLRSRDLVAPFHGVRSVRPIVTLEETCAALLPTMGPHDIFSDVTAARLWRMPLPDSMKHDELLHISSPPPERAARMTGVAGHQRIWLPEEATRLGKLPVASPAQTWCHLSMVLGLPDLVAVGDYIVTGNPFRDQLPLGSLHDLVSACIERRGGRGSKKRTLASRLIRVGPLSRPESLVRLVVVDAGVPEPDINVQVFDDRGSFLAMPDLSWRKYMVALEYEGDHHREQVRFRQDIHRIERLVDHGWTVVKVSADDLFLRPDELAARVIRRLRSNGWPR